MIMVCKNKVLLDCVFRFSVFQQWLRYYCAKSQYHSTTYRYRKLHVVYLLFITTQKIVE